MGARVLIVEDEVINAMGLAMMIPGWGCSVVEMVTSGEDAIRVAEAMRPDVVLMDINIHGSINGIAAAREIIECLDIPVVFMTGYDDDATVASAMDLKPLAFMVKPIDLVLLEELLTGL